MNDPSLTVYLPAEGKATGSAIVVAPGGGHRFLAASHEGQDVGRWLAEHGIVGAVLKYRLYRQVGSPYRRGDAIADGERAVRIVRSAPMSGTCGPTGSASWASRRAAT